MEPITPQPYTSFFISPEPTPDQTSTPTTLTTEVAQRIHTHKPTQEFVSLKKGRLVFIPPMPDSTPSLPDSILYCKEGPITAYTCDLIQTMFMPMTHDEKSQFCFQNNYWPIPSHSHFHTYNLKTFTKFAVRLYLYYKKNPYITLQKLGERPQNSIQILETINLAKSQGEIYLEEDLIEFLDKKLSLTRKCELLVHFYNNEITCYDDVMYRFIKRDLREVINQGLFINFPESLRKQLLLEVQLGKNAIDNL